MSKFTVKWCNEDGNIATERLIDADQVQVKFDNRTPDAHGTAQFLGIYQVPPTGIVVIGNPNDGAESMALASGTVYVMNEQGATVARYRLAETNQHSDGRDKLKAHYATPKMQPGYKEEAA